MPALTKGKRFDLPTNVAESTSFDFTPADMKLVFICMVSTPLYQLVRGTFLLCDCFKKLFYSGALQR